MWDRRKRRIFHRCLFGISRSSYVRFLTLTSTSKSDFSLMNDHFRLFIRKLREFAYPCEYIKVKTNEGFGVLHVLLRSPYIPSYYISSRWKTLHSAYIVKILKLRDSGKRLASYLVSHYLAKQSYYRIGYSQGWIFKGACRVWKELCWRFSYRMSEILFRWRNILRNPQIVSVGLSHRLDEYGWAWWDSMLHKGSSY